MLRDYEAKLDAAIAAVAPAVDMYTCYDNSKADGLTGQERWQENYQAVQEANNRYEILWSKFGEPFSRAQPQSDREK